MRNTPGFIKAFRQEQGAVIVTVALSLIFLVAIAALAIDIGYLYTTRNELQNVADAAALAGARYLGAVYSDLDLHEMAVWEFNETDVYNVITAIAQENKAARRSISIDLNDVGIGLWDPEKSTDDIWQETLTSPDAVRVIARRDASINTRIGTFFGGILGIDEMAVTSKMAIAALSGPSYVHEGELKTPFGISENHFPNPPTLLTFSPTGTSGVAWHNFYDTKPGDLNANALAAKMISIIRGDNRTYEGLTSLSGEDWLMNNFKLNKLPDPVIIPQTPAGTEFRFDNGEKASLYSTDVLLNYDGDIGTPSGNGKNPAAMFAMFDYFRYRDGDNDNSQWTSVVPVYADAEEKPDFMPPNDKLEIVGFAEAVITGVNGPPDKSIEIKIYDFFTLVDGRGSGTTYGKLKGTIPTLVK